MYWQDDEDRRGQPSRQPGPPPDPLRWRPYFPQERTPSREVESSNSKRASNWLPGVIVLLLLAVGVWLAVAFLPQIGLFLASMQHVGSGHPPEERLTGFLAVGFIGVVIVAVVRILTRNGSDRRD